MAAGEHTQCHGQCTSLPCRLVLLFRAGGSGGWCVCGLHGGPSGHGVRQHSKVADRVSPGSFTCRQIEHCGYCCAGVMSTPLHRVWALSRRLLCAGLPACMIKGKQRIAHATLASAIVFCVQVRAVWSIHPLHHLLLGRVITSACSGACGGHVATDCSQPREGDPLH